MNTERKLSNELELKAINVFAWERVRQYQQLKIGTFEVSTPFYSNEIGPLFAKMMKDSGVPDNTISGVLRLFHNHAVPYGWFHGKGTPEQIIFAAKEIAKQWDLDLSKATDPNTIIEFMKAAGLGIDCSGFVYQTLNFALNEAGCAESLASLLKWSDPKKEKNEYRADVKTFASSTSRINPTEIQPIDIITVKEANKEKYSHMALILEEDARLMVVQSVIGQVPTGVHISSISIENDLPRFGFKPNLTKPWEELYNAEALEFRRFKTFQNS